MGFRDFMSDYTPLGMMGLYDKSPERPSYPGYDTSKLQPLIDEYLGLARQGQGQQVGMPQEFDISSQYLQGLMQQQPSQYELPIDDINKALQAQQEIQMQDYMKQIRPTLARQGQLDSSYYTNLLGDYKQGQQSDYLTNYANLLTNQAQTNLQNQQWLTGQQAGAAGQLAGIGGQRAGVDLQNIQLPFQTTLPALQQGYGMQEGLQNNLFNQQLGAYGQEMDVYNQNKQSYDQTRAMLWQAALGAATGGMGMIPGVTGGMMGAGTGALGGATGQLGSMAGGGMQQTDLSSLLKSLNLNTGQSSGQPFGTYTPYSKGGSTVGSRYFPQFSFN